VLAQLLAIVSGSAYVLGVAKLDVRNLGDYIREQRSAAQISLRQLAKAAGVSNPYLSQIERGLRKPSAEILQQIAKALRISAEALYVQAGILDERYGDSDVPTAVLGDAAITERQKQVLLEIYESFRRENAERPEAPEAATVVTPDDAAVPATAEPTAQADVETVTATSSAARPGRAKRTASS
jgi:transcriptional regulator with XRE-family HTH domain